MEANKWRNELKNKKVTNYKWAGNGRFTYIKCFLKIWTMHRFHFIFNYSFCTFRTIHVFDAVLNKTHKNQLINFKLSPMHFWRNLHLFEYQKRPNRIKKKSFPHWHILCWVLSYRPTLYNILKNRSTYYSVITLNICI